MSSVSKSPWVIHYDGSSCNGCDIEVLATLCPGFDAERFGVVNVGNPKHADIFLITGSINEQNREVVRQIYEQMVDPKIVVACGTCACGGGVFKECYNVIGGASEAVPVDVSVPGCAVRPESIIDAIVRGVELLEQRSAELAKEGKGRKIMSYSVEYRQLSAEELLAWASCRKADGWRFIQMCCAANDDAIDAIYTIRKGSLVAMATIPGLVPGDHLPSISGQWPEAFVFENEAHDLYGIEIDGMIIDFHGTFYQLSEPTPMVRGTSISVVREAVSAQGTDADEEVSHVE